MFSDKPAFAAPVFTATRPSSVSRALIGYRRRALREALSFGYALTPLTTPRRIAGDARGARVPKLALAVWSNHDH